MAKYDKKAVLRIMIEATKNYEEKHYDICTYLSKNRGI